MCFGYVAPAAVDKDPTLDSLSTSGSTPVKHFNPANPTGGASLQQSYGDIDVREHKTQMVIQKNSEFIKNMKPHKSLSNSGSLSCPKP